MGSPVVATTLHEQERSCGSLARTHRAVNVPLSMPSFQVAKKTAAKAKRDSRRSPDRGQDPIIHPPAPQPSHHTMNQQLPGHALSETVQLWANHAGLRWPVAFQSLKILFHERQIVIPCWPGACEGESDATRDTVLGM